MSKNTEKKAAERAEEKASLAEENASNFGITDPKVQQDAEREAAAKAAERRVEEQEAETNKKGHVKMHKLGEEIHVHPTTVADHETQGWRLSA